MKLYLSSMELGHSSEKLKELFQNTNHKCAYISNALDTTNDLEKRKNRETNDIKDLTKLGLKVEHVNLKNYFQKQSLLQKKLLEFAMVWVSGGNTFVLRQAMKLSGFDDIITQFYKEKSDFIYGSYSAGACVLCPSLKGSELVDPSNIGPYFKQTGTIWEGLGIIDFTLVVHYQSDHPESENANKELQYYIDNKVNYKTLKDGEVIILCQSLIIK